MIAAGIAQGLAFLPYALGMGLTELERALQHARAVPLDEAYRAAFGVSLTDPRVHRRTGDVRDHERLGGPGRGEALQEANRAFHRLLVGQGMSEETARKYVLVADAAHSAPGGPVLLAVVLRHTRMEPFRARSKQTNSTATLRSDQRAWYEAYDRDVDGQPVDEVMDWAALEHDVLDRDKALAALLVLAAEAVKFDRRAPDYWQVERRWRAGETAALVQQSADKVKRALAS
jgi:hypothetical protein